MDPEFMEADRWVLQRAEIAAFLRRVAQHFEGTDASLGHDAQRIAAKYFAPPEFRMHTKDIAYSADEINRIAEEYRADG